MKWSPLPMQDILRNLKETKHLLVLHLCNIQIQKYIANKKIILNYTQMKYKWHVTAIKPLKNKLVSVTSNRSTIVYFMSSIVNFILG